MPYIIDDYAFIAKRMAELKKQSDESKVITGEQPDDPDIEDVLIVGYCGDFYC